MKTIIIALMNISTPQDPCAPLLSVKGSFALSHAMI